MKQYGGVTIQADGVLDTFDMLRVQSLGGKVKKVIREEIRPAQKSVTASAKVAMAKDPRGAAKAVKMVIYKGGKGKSYGGNINIFKPKTGGKSMALWNDTNKGGRSGIRRRRRVSKRTKQIRGYTGADRWFILHWVDAGTPGRAAKRPYRGIIRPSNFFTRSAGEQMNQATTRVMRRVGAMIRNGGK